VKLCFRFLVPRGFRSGFILSGKAVTPVFNMVVTKNDIVEEDRQGIRMHGSGIFWL